MVNFKLGFIVSYLYMEKLYRLGVAAQSTPSQVKVRIKTRWEGEPYTALPAENITIGTSSRH